MANQNQANLPAEAKQLVGQVEARVNEMVKDGGLTLPTSYSASNALRAAYLQIQETEDRNHNPALQVCTKVSITNALLNMIVLGLNPAKKQCYPMVYGKKLVMQPSYFGDMAIAKRVDRRIRDINYTAVYKGDQIQMEVWKGMDVVTKHTRTMESMESGEVVGAYCTLWGQDGAVINSVFMPISKIHQSWRQSSAKPFDDKGKLKSSSTHYKFPAEMAARTAIRKACKPIINSSDDNYLNEALVETFAGGAGAEVEAEITDNANQGDTVDISTGEVVDAEFSPDDGGADDIDQPSQDREQVGASEDDAPDTGANPTKEGSNSETGEPTQQPAF